MVHATRIGKRPKVRLDENLSVACLCEAFVKAGPQAPRICNAFVDARVVLVLGAQDQLMRWKFNARRKGFDFGPVASQKMRAARSALGHAHDLDAQAVIQPHQQFQIPREHPAERVEAKAAFTGQAQPQPRQFHAFAGFAPRSIELATRSQHISGERAELVGIEPGDMLDETAKTVLQNRRNDSFFAVLGQKGDPLACVHGLRSHQIGS